MHRKPLTPVEIRIRQPSAVTAATIQKKFETFFQRDGEDLVFRSWLEPHLSVGEHLKWLHGMIQHDAKFLRQLSSTGVSIVICIRSGDRPLCIEPEALLLAHKLNLTTEIRFGK